jgi:predicted permease
MFREWLHAQWFRFKALANRRRLERDLDDELQFHLAMREQKLVEEGMSSEEARYTARRAIGNQTQTKESNRELWSFPFLETLAQDLRYGLRQLRRNPGFTVVTILTLALGIGATTAIFSVVNAVLLRPLPYKDPGRLVDVSERILERRWAVSPANYLDWQRQNHVFDKMGIALAFSEDLYLAGEGQPEAIQGRRVSGSFFPVLGVPPILGRTFLLEEDNPGHPVVVLTYRFWQRKFGSDRNIIGRQMRFNGDSYTVVGVMPKGFQVLDRYNEKSREDVYLPNPFGSFPRTVRDSYALEVVARLRPGRSLAQAQAEMDAIARRLELAYPKTNKEHGVKVTPLRDVVIQREYGTKFRPTLLMLMGAVGLVLLIACVNVASLLLVRSVTREREIAVRTALGAGRTRMIRQLLTESFLLTTLGGALGALLAVASVPVLVAMSPTDIPRLDEVAVDGSALGFALVVALVTGFLCGLIPALKASRLDLNQSLKEGSPAGRGSLAQQRSLRLLVMTEIALALVLSAGAGLVIRSFLRLHNESLGFDPQNVLTAQVSLPFQKYAELTKPAAKALSGTDISNWWRVQTNTASFVRQVVERLEHLPGVQSAGVVNFPPLGVGWGDVFGIEGVPPMMPPDEYGWSPGPRALYRGVGGDYFQTMGIRLIKGRYFTKQEYHAGAPVAIVNRRLAQNFFPDSHVLGKRLRVKDSYVGPARMLETVGVVEDINNGWPSAESWKGAKYTIYMPFDQQAQTFVGWQLSYRLHATFAVRTASNPVGLSAIVRQAIWEADPDQPIEKLTSMKDFVSEHDSQRRFCLLVLSILAGVALVLATVGIYGVMAYSVSQRTHEIGVRRALGAEEHDIMVSVLGQGALLSLLGVGLGLSGSLALTGLLASFLYQVSPTDVGTLAGVACIMMSVALLATYIPARRAAKVDPMVALRYE